MDFNLQCLVPEEASELTNVYLGGLCKYISVIAGVAGYTVWDCGVHVHVVVMW